VLQEEALALHRFTGGTCSNRRQTALLVELLVLVRNGIIQDTGAAPTLIHGHHTPDVGKCWSLDLALCSATQSRNRSSNSLSSGVNEATYCAALSPPQQITKVKKLDAGEGCEAPPIIKGAIISSQTTNHAQSRFVVNVGVT
jgi:hypothetical protein